MTVQGARALEEEVKHLKGVLRPQISQAIAEARELGDLKENAEYHAAREQQGMVEARIRDIEAKLSNAQVIDVTAIPHSGKVIFGTTVDIANVETDELSLIHICFGRAGQCPQGVPERLPAQRPPAASGDGGGQQGAGGNPAFHRRAGLKFDATTPSG